MLKLYGGAISRASIIKWYLGELGVPYEFVLLDMQAGAHKQTDFLAINPLGKAPAIVEGDFKLWESGAILLYLAEKYGRMPPLLEERAEITQWVLFANATLAPVIFVEASRDELPRLLTPLNQVLERQPFLVGGQFSLADIALGMLLAYIPMMLKINLSAYPAIRNYIKMLSERPAFQQAIGLEKVGSRKSEVKTVHASPNAS